MKIAIGSDHGGYDLKEQVKTWLQEMGHEVEDFGCYSKESCDYPDFGAAAARAVASGQCEKGVVICTTGIGISMTANKVKGIRCALCADPWSAEMTRRHNDANMLAMGAGVVGPQLARQILEAFLTHDFEGGRHQRRVDKLMALHSTLYENWTDVNGVCVANPHFVQMPKTISSLSYREMYLLAKNGAQVLHPTAVRIAQRSAISIRVANYLNPCSRDTLVSNCPSQEAFLAVTEKHNGKGFLTTLLHRMPLGKVFDILHRALDNNRFNGVDEGIISVLTDKNVVQVQSQQSLLRTLYDAFCTL